MKDKLLTYYNKELSYFRNYSKEFAKKHPKVAGNLGLNETEIEDPHVARLIEAVSFLTARVQQNIDAGLPELTESIFGVLYPDYFAPLPATGVFSFALKEGVDKPYTIARGTRFRAIQNGMAECRFRTCYETVLYPVTISKSSYRGLPFDVPELANKRVKVQSRLTLELSATSQNLDEDGFTISNFRCFLKGQQEYTAKLLELIHNDTVLIAITDKDNPQERTIISADNIRHVGFADDEAVIPYDNKSFSGYRLLSELYHTPDKFLFFEIENFNQKFDQHSGQKEITFYCSEHYPDLEQYLTEKNFVLGASPAINLFEHTAELIDVEPAINDYKVKPSAGQPDSYEVHHIIEVNSIDEKGDKKPLQPIYKPNINRQQSWVWNFKRETALMAGGKSSAGLETSVTLIEQENRSEIRPKFLQLVTECSNRNLTNKLRLAEGGCQLLFAKPTPTISRLKLEGGLTKPKRPQVSDSTRWQLARHINLSYLSESGVSGLKEVLALYNFYELPEVENMIDGIQELTLEPSVSRAVIGGHSGVIHGNDLTLTCDEEYYTGTSVYFFGCVLNAFLSQLCQVNSYVKLSIKIQGHKDKAYKWPVLNGKVKLL